MKKTKIIFWVTTIAIFLFEGVMSALTSHTEFAIKGVTDLGYPRYFSMYIMVWKVLGSLVLVLPLTKVSARVKEWAYAGFGIDFISAFASIAIVTGLGAGLILPAIFMVILYFSYTSYHKLNPNIVIN
jgi:hypothetical protein